jgi:hypothetical protein
VTDLAVWTAKTESIPDGRRIQIYHDDEPVSFRSYLERLEQGADFASWYTKLLCTTDYKAFFWEHPPLCNANVESNAEFVLLDASALAGLHPDPVPFQSHFGGDNEIVTFRSLGGDALLIAPKPCEPLAACAHLAAFVREAPEPQIQELWRETGRTVRETLGDRNLWLSTSGLGVSWLHIRLDSYPKYYQHRPYTETKGKFGLR